MKKKWIHIIGICGKATSLVAFMFKNKNWFVTGSDIQYFPPASDFLVAQNIPHAKGYSYKHLTQEFWQQKGYNPPSKHPSLCMVISTASEKNTQLKFAKVKNIPVEPMSKILGKYLVKENSIVVAGSSGKTTTTSLCVHTLKSLNYNPSYMIGAETLNLKYSIQNTDSNWSVVEGDEYHNPNPLIEGNPKFLEYKPKYLILTNINWEHHDVFPAFDLYLKAFEKLILLLPKDGILVYKHDDSNILKILRKLGDSCVAKKVSFGKNKKADFSYDFDIKDGTTVFKIFEKEKYILEGITNLLGEYNLENIVSVYSLLSTLGFDLKEYGKIVKNFSGVKKRLEILHNSEELTIIDDFGVTPSRARRSLSTVKKYFPQKSIIAIFDPNSGSRIKDKQLFYKEYKNAFDNTDYMFIPELSDFDNKLASRDEMISYLLDLGVNIDPTLQWFEKVKKIIKERACVVIFFSSYRLTSTAHTLAHEFSNN
jgi:UDP-N-acetylmuramate-alanine ligase